MQKHDELKSFAEKNRKPTVWDLAEAIKVDPITPYRLQAEQWERKAQAILKNAIEPTVNIITASYPTCANDAIQMKYGATILTAAISTTKIAVDNSKDEENAKTRVEDMATSVGQLGYKANKPMDFIKSCSKKRQPPT